MEEITLQTRYSEHILDQFNRARAELLEVIEGPGPVPREGEKENIPERSNIRVNNIKVSSKLILPQGGGSTTTTTDSGAGTFRSATVEHQVVKSSSAS